MGLVTDLAGQSVYLDADIFIYALEGHERFAAVLAELFGAIDRGEIRAVTSELTLAEVLVKPLMDGNTARQTAYQQALRNTSSRTVVPIDRAVLLEAAQLRAATSLRLPDAIHVATARLTGCSAFISNDARLRAGAGPPVIVMTEIA